MNIKVLQRKVCRPFGLKWGNGINQKIKSAKCCAISSKVGAGVLASSSIIALYGHHSWTASGLMLLTLAGLKVNKLAKAHVSKLCKSYKLKSISDRFDKIYSNIQK